jgi:hypothetical protein
MLINLVILTETVGLFGDRADRCYIQLDLFRQFKIELVRWLEGLVFEEKISN